MEMAEVSIDFGPVTAKGAAPTPGNDGSSLVGKVKIVGTSPTQDEGLSPPSSVDCPSSSWHFFARSASCCAHCWTNARTSPWPSASCT